MRVDVYFIRHHLYIVVYGHHIALWLWYRNYVSTVSLPLIEINLI